MSAQVGWDDMDVCTEKYGQDGELIWNVLITHCLNLKLVINKMTMERKLIKFILFNFYSQQLTLEHVKTLKMDEDVLGVKYSPDQRLVAVSLLDNTIKVFFTDSLKVFCTYSGDTCSSDYNETS